MKIQCAEEKNYADVRDFYYSLIEAMKDSEFEIGWERDIYPTQEFLLTSIHNRELYAAKSGSSLLACMIVNHSYNDGYKNISWSVDARDDELLVIYALGVHPLYAGQGIARQMVQHVIDMARKNEIKTIRLDVLGGNIPAERVYMKMGFHYLATLQMFYEDTGWTDYKVFEYLV